MIEFMVGFLLLICLLAVLIIGFKFLASQLGFTVPQPIMAIAGIIIFVILFLFLMNWTGLYVWGSGLHHIH